jgi:purine-cytosine permease-like protein
VHRVFTIWFTPNLVSAAFFVGVLAVDLNLGFALGTAAIVVGTVPGAMLVSVMCTWGPRTGLGQLPLARLQFGRTVALPGLLMWGSTIAWDAINAIFGAAVPFMDTSLFVGYASSHWLQGGDIAFVVGFLVGGAVYVAIRRAQTGTARDVPAPAERQSPALGAAAAA